MRVPSDNPFCSVSGSDAHVGASPSAYLYPSTPIVVVNFTSDSTNDPETELEKELILQHEFLHALQMALFWPLSIVVLDLIIHTMLHWITPADLSGKLERVSEVFRTWAPFLEGHCILTHLTNAGRSDAEKRRLLGSVFDGRHDVHVKGLRTLLGQEDVDESSVWEFSKRDDASDRLDLCTLYANMAAFVKDPNLNIKNLFNKAETERIAQLASEVIYGQGDLSKMQKDLEGITDETWHSWEAFYESLGRGLARDETYMKDIFHQLVVGDHPLAVPVFYRDTYAVLASKHRRQVERAQLYEHAKSWLAYAMALETANVKRGLWCPVYRMSCGKEMYLCGVASPTKVPFSDGRPSIEWCTLNRVPHADRVIDIDTRAEVCFFWAMVDVLVKQYFRDAFRRLCEMGRMSYRQYERTEEFRERYSRIVFRDSFDHGYSTGGDGVVFICESVPNDSHDATKIRGIDEAVARSTVLDVPDGVLCRKEKAHIVKQIQRISRGTSLIIARAKGDRIRYFTLGSFMFLLFMRHLRQSGELSRGDAFVEADRILDSGALPLIERELPWGVRVSVLQDWLRMPEEVDSDEEGIEVLSSPEEFYCGLLDEGVAETESSPRPLESYHLSNAVRQHMFEKRHPFLSMLLLLFAACGLLIYSVLKRLRRTTDRPEDGTRK